MTSAGDLGTVDLSRVGRPGPIGPPRGPGVPSISGNIVDVTMLCPGHPAHLFTQHLFTAWQLFARHGSYLRARASGPLENSHVGNGVLLFLGIPT